MPDAIHRPRAVLTVLAVLLVATACGGGGGDSTGVTNTPDVSAVYITGAPSNTMLPGDSVTFVAKATNGEGAPIYNASVTWKSSAPAVASVTTSGVVTALSAGHTTITATVGSRDGTFGLDVGDGGRVGPEGGIITAAGGIVTVNVPPNILSQPTVVAVTAVPTPASDTRLIPDRMFALGPQGYQLCGTLTIRYNPTTLPAGIAEQSLQLYTVVGNGWDIVQGSKVDLTAKTVYGTFCGMGTYAIRSTAVSRIDLAGTSAGGALFIGQSDQLTTSLFDSGNRALPARPMTWTSSNPAVVSVDGTGKVSAVGAGSATITVATDGKSATTTVTAIARATPDWSQATDWTTYRGDSRHSGYVDATLDAAAFREKWTTTLTNGGALNPPSVGGGQLYVATSYGWQSQTLYAFDAATGAQRWTRDFGSIYDLNQPTYYGGKLYVTTGNTPDAFLYSLDALDGSVSYQSAFDSQWQRWKAPVIAGSSVVIAGGTYGGMYGFDLATGAQTFFLDDRQSDDWAPAALSSTIYRTGDSGLVALNPVTGAITGSLNDARLVRTLTPVVGDANDLLTIDGSRVLSVDLGTMQVKWDQGGAYLGMPVVGKNVVYGFKDTVVVARSEADGSLLWSWTPPAPYTVAQPATSQSMALTNNLLFVSLSATADPRALGITVAIDLASHLTVWTYPLAGDLTLSSQGYLFISKDGQIAAIAVK